MDGISVKVDSRGTLKTLRLAQAFFGRPTRLYKAAQDVLEERVSRSFDTKQDPSKTLWADWAPSTAEQRRNSGGSAFRAGPGSLLDRTGDMRDSFFAEIQGDTVTAGFTAPYAQFHETGTRNMPARPILTDGRGGLAIPHRQAVGIAVRKAVQEALDEIFI